MKDAVVVLPVHLFYDHPLVSDHREVFLVEESRYFTYHEFHKKKLVLHRASMKAYQKLLEERGSRVRYIEFDMDWMSKIRGFDVSMIRPYDRELESRLPDNVSLSGGPGFLGGELKKKKRYRMGSFYRNQRMRSGILMDPVGPEGGKWSFDKENRKSLPGDHQPPPLSKFFNDHVREATDYVNDKFPENPGETDDFFYPTTHGEAREALEDFIGNRLHLFGDYQDAISKEYEVLYHSLLSSSINIGLLTPVEVISAVEVADAPLNSREGFIRQVLGWREFILKIYLEEGEMQRNNNHFNHERGLPQSFYQASTGSAPVDNVIEKVIRNAYAHHIERLMVLGNYMLLNEYDPDVVYRWFMEMFIDAYDWVMVPNVYGMSQYADGGLMSTKPYISSSNYIRKMSDFEKGDWCGEWDELFWDFIDRHKEEFSKNPRMSLMVKQLERRKRK